MTKEIILNKEVMNEVAKSKIYGDGVSVGLTIGMLVVLGVELAEIVKTRKLRKELKNN